MCCGGMICKCCTLLVLVVILIGFLFGFGVFKHGFHKLKDSVHLDLTNYAAGAAGRHYHYGLGRPFLGHGAAPPPSLF